MQKKGPRAIPMANLPDGRKLFDRMPNPMQGQDDPAYFDDIMDNIIYESRGEALHPRAMAKPSISERRKAKTTATKMMVSKTLADTTTKKRLMNKVMHGMTTCIVKTENMA